MKPFVKTGLMVAALSGMAFSPTTATETFAFEDYFRGKTVTYGKFSAINAVNRRFKVNLNGIWNGKTLKLIEKFKYDDGMR